MKRSLLAGVFLALVLFPLSPSGRPLAAGAGAGPSMAVAAERTFRATVPIEPSE